MPITIDLNKQAHSVSSQSVSTPEGLRHAVCSNFAIAVNQLAKKSSLSYNLDANILQRVVARYLEQHPTHNNPFNIVLKEKKELAVADFYDLNYRFEGMSRKPRCFNRNPSQPVMQRQGVFEHIVALGRAALVNGKVTYIHGEVKDGQFQYIPALQGMELVDGTRTAANGRVTQGRWAFHPELERMDLVRETGRRAHIPELGHDALVEGTKKFVEGREEVGRFAYISELNDVRLVAGKIRLSDGEVQEGLRQYIPELNIVCLVEGKSTLPNGAVEEGLRQHIPELRGVCLVEGKLTLANGTVEEGKRQYIPEVKGVCLVVGKATFANGKVCDGLWRYIPELNGVCLVDGKVFFAHGDVQEGKRQYIPALSGVYLVNGKATFANGAVEEGRFAYVPELNGMRLLEGKKTHPNGEVEVGCWTYNATFNRMVYMSDMGSRLQRWVREGEPSELRAEALQRMVQAHGNRAIQLSLEGLNLQTLPHDIRLLASLEVLDVANNALSTLPPCLGELRQLRTLLVRNNPNLTDLPETIFRLPSLQRLDVSDCQNLRYLPTGFERLPARTMVNLERTGLSVNVLEAARRAVELVRTQSIGVLGPQIHYSLPAQTMRNVMPLGAEMLEWFKEVVPDAADRRMRGVQKGLLKDLHPSSAQALATFLMRLRRTGLYTFAPQAMASRVMALLTGVIDQPKLLETFCAMALECTETCDDRTALGMLNMELALVESQALDVAMVSTGSKRETLQRLFDLGQGVFKQRALMDMAHQHALRASGFVDETEIVLRYLTRLGADLQLPVQWAHMLFEQYAFQVTDDDLAVARVRLQPSATLDNPEFLGFMCNWHPFQTVLKHLEPKVCEQVERDLLVVKRGVETEQERLFEEYERVCVRHGAESVMALNLITAMNQNAAKIKPLSDAVWCQAVVGCLGGNKV